MDPDDEVCVCFHVTVRKLRHYLDRERPTVASGLSECLGAGTGCHWCVPYLRRLHEQWRNGALPELEVGSEDYRRLRDEYRRAGSASREPE